MPAHLNYRRFLFETPHTAPECREWLELLAGNDLEFDLSADVATVTQFRPHEVDAVREALQRIHHFMDDAASYLEYCVYTRDFSDKSLEELQDYNPDNCSDNLLAAILTVNDPNGEFYGAPREDLLSLFMSEVAK